MWTKTPVTDAIGCRYPIIQGPMGSGHSTPALVAAVSNAGGLGSLGAYHMQPAEIVAAGETIRRLTSQPFALNLWIPRTDPVEAAGAAGAADGGRRALALLRPYRDELGLPPLDAPPHPEPRQLEAQVEAVLEVQPRVFSYIFGVLSAPLMAEVKRRGILTIGVATTVDEAEAHEASGADMVCASGFEAGGHRGSFFAPPERSLMGTLALVPQVASAVRVPVIAAGGIGDSRGVAAVLALGAAAAQLGTAFLMCAESGASPLHRAALADRRRARRTLLTRAFSGRLARVIANRFAEEMEPHAADLLPYPLQGVATRDLRPAAAAAGRDDLAALFSGQSAPLAVPRPAADLVAALVEEVNGVLARLAPAIVATATA
jgi:nitronate monooxygenase